MGYSPVSAEGYGVSPLKFINIYLAAKPWNVRKLTWGYKCSSEISTCQCCNFSPGEEFSWLLDQDNQSKLTDGSGNVFLRAMKVFSVLLIPTYHSSFNIRDKIPWPEEVQCWILKIDDKGKTNFKKIPSFSKRWWCLPTCCPSSCHWEFLGCSRCCLSGISETPGSPWTLFFDAIFSNINDNSFGC